MNNLSPLKVAMFVVTGIIIGGSITTIVGMRDDFSRLEGKVETLHTNYQHFKEERAAEKKEVLGEIKAQAEKELNNINLQREKALHDIQVEKEAINQLKNLVEEKIKDLNQTVDDIKNEIAKPLEEKIAQVQSEIQRLNSEMKKNVKLLYWDNDDGTVTDNRTQLIWLKNANCFGKMIWENAMQKAANLKSGQCGLSDDSHAGDWRLPTKKEWNVMVDRRYNNPAIPNAAGTSKWEEGDAFSGVQAGYYWSSSAYVNSPTNASIVNLLNGTVNSAYQPSATYVWPVRGGQ